jgi:hypothetical protein
MITARHATDHANSEHKRQDMEEDQIETDENRNVA